MGRAKICRQAGCGVTVVDVDYCTKHTADNSVTTYDKFRNANDPIRKMYKKASWLTFRSIILANNPMCSVVEHGEPCTCPAVVVHHKIDPKESPLRFLDPTNVQAVCAKHHAGGQRGETQNRKYTPTKYPKWRV